MSAGKISNRNKLILVVLGALVLLMNLTHSSAQEMGTVPAQTQADVPAQAQVAEAAPQAKELPGNLPVIDVQFNLDNAGGFDQSILVSMAGPFDLNKIRDALLNGGNTEEVSEWVKSAEYSKPDEAGRYRYKLVIGKAFIKFAHNYNCNESNQDGWIQDCLQSADDDDSVVKNGHNTVECLSDSNAAQTHCLFRSKGLASSISVLGSKLEGGFLATKLFVENVAYVAHMGLMISGKANGVEQAKSLFKQTGYSKLVEDLEVRIENEREKRMNTLVVQSSLSGRTVLGGGQLAVAAKKRALGRAARNRSQMK